MTEPKDPWQSQPEQPTPHPPPPPPPAQDAWGRPVQGAYDPQQYATQQQQAWGYAQPSYPQPPPIPRDSGKATASLVLGITGIFGLLMCCPLVMPILAVVLGNQARREIRESNGWVRGEGQAKAGVIMGWVGIALSVLLIVGLILAIALGGFEDSSYYDDDPIFSLLAPLPALLS
jgi:hypothetical protein